MLTANIIKLLNLAGLKVKAETNNVRWVKAECPFAPWTHEHGTDINPSFGITISPGPSAYNCFSCGKKGRLMGLPSSLSRYTNAISIIKTLSDHILRYDISEFSTSHFPEYGSEKVYRVPNTHIWPKSFLNDFPSVTKHANALKYLSKRQINARVIRKLDLRYDPQRRRVCFPTIDTEGNLVGLHGRSVDAESPLLYYAYKYKDTYNSHIWTNTNNIDLNNPLVIVESVFDLASVLRVYSNVICSRSASLSNDLMLTIPACPYLITLYDNDAAGDMARKFISLKSSSPVTHLLPTKGCKDPGEMTEEEILVVLKRDLVSVF